MVAYKRYAVIAVVALVALYMIANYTSADTAKKFGLVHAPVTT